MRVEFIGPKEEGFFGSQVSSCLLRRCYIRVCSEYLFADAVSFFLSFFLSPFLPSFLSFCLPPARLLAFVPAETGQLVTEYSKLAGIIQQPPPLAFRRRPTPKQQAERHLWFPRGCFGG
jgi:hypothetical protein